MVVGSFTSLGGGTGATPRHNLGRSNADGSLDTGFDAGANGFWVFRLAMAGWEDLLAGGDFTMLGGGGTGSTSRNHLGRVTTNTGAAIQASTSRMAPPITWSRSAPGRKCRA